MHRSALSLIACALACSTAIARPLDAAEPSSCTNDLYRAVATGNMAGIRKALAAGADINARFVDGYTVALVAIEHANPNALSYLLDRGADANALTFPGGASLLMSASGQETTAAKRLAMVKCLLAHGANARLEDDSPGNALSYATRVGDAPVMAALLKAGASPNVRNRFGDTLLIQAVDAGKPSVVKLLLDRKADANAANHWRLTPLMFAAAMGRLDLARLLLARRADPNRQDRQGKTALAYAVEEDYPAVAALIRRSGGRAFGRWAREAAAIRALPSAPIGPPLLRRSKRIVSAGPFLGAPAYVWASDHEVVQFRAHATIEEGTRILTTEGARFCRYDTKSRKETTLSALTRLVSTTASDWDLPSSMFSPDGRWALWAGNDNAVCAARLDGTGFRQWPGHAQSTLEWASDSRRWMAWLWDGVHGKTAAAEVGNVMAPHSTATYPIPPKCLAQPDNNERYPTTLIDGDRVIALQWTYDEHRRRHDSVRIVSIRLGAPERPTTSIAIRPPRGGVIDDLAFSPARDRIAWVFRFRKGSTAGLWVSRADGTRMRPLGYMSLKGHEEFSRPDLPASVDGYRFARAEVEPHTLQWTPDGKRVSFIHRDQIYTIPCGPAAR